MQRVTRRSIRSESGTSLLEVVIAAGMLAIVILVGLTAVRSDMGTLRRQTHLSASAQIDEALVEVVLRRANAFYFGALAPGGTRCRRNQNDFSQALFAQEVPGGMAFGPDLYMLGSVPAGPRIHTLSSMSFDNVHGPAQTAMTRCSTKTFFGPGNVDFGNNRGLTFCFTVRGRMGTQYDPNSLLSHRPVLVEATYYVDDLRQTDRPTCNELASRWYAGAVLDPNRPPVNTHLFYTIYWQARGAIGNANAMAAHSRTVALTQGYR